MPPPRRRSAQPEQARGLGGNTVSRHQLLLLTDRAEKAERVRAEADQPQRCQRQQADRGRGGHLEAFARLRRREHEEGQNQTRRDLDADARHQCDRGRAKAGARAGAQRERRGEQQQDQRVVVCAADGQLEQHRVQAHERRGPAARMTEPPGGPRDQRDRAEARGDRDGLECPQPARDAERRGGVAREREQGPVGGVQEGPADEPEHSIRGRFRRHMRVRVKAVQGSQAGEAQIAEHVLGDERRPEQEDQVRGHDRRHERPPRQRSRRAQDKHVARAHDQRQRLEAVVADADAEPLQRAGHPARPPAAASRYILRGVRGGPGRQQEYRRDHADQAERAQRPQGAVAALHAARRGYAGRRLGGWQRAGCGCRGPYMPIVTSRGPASV
jgi:hypothetical protein